MGKKKLQREEFIKETGLNYIFEVLASFSSRNNSNISAETASMSLLLVSFLLPLRIYAMEYILEP